MQAAGKMRGRTRQDARTHQARAEGTSGNKRWSRLADRCLGEGWECWQITQDRKM